MKLPAILSPRHVLWRKIHFWAVNNFPPFLVPVSMFFAALPFWLGWVPGRRRLTENLEMMFGRQPVRNFFRGMTVVYNFAWSMTDTWMFAEQKAQVDWEFEGLRHFVDLARSEHGAIILTAHMGNYDLGSYFFAEKVGRPISIVRIPEHDQRTEELARDKRSRSVGENLSVTYNTAPDTAAVSLYERLRAGEIIAIQGDRAYDGLSSRHTRLFGTDCVLPDGPFELARAARVPIYPLFVVRSGLHRYRVIVLEPIVVSRHARDRSGDIERAMDEWGAALEKTLETWWHQWAAFEVISA